jgi:hypothetical protein
MFPLLFKVVLVFLERKRLRRAALLTAMVASRVARSPRARRAVVRVSTAAARGIKRRWSTRQPKRSRARAAVARLRA